MLELRIAHVKPGMPTKVWDAKLMNGRRDIRVFETIDGLEFIEINVLTNSDGMPGPETGLLPRPQKISKSQRRKLARKKNK